MDEDKKPQPATQDAYFDTAIRAVRQKKPPPEIDFTLHTMEDGTQVSTEERVCKGMFASLGETPYKSFPAQCSFLAV
jgi:serine/threonine-protein phosphatase 2B catalytic subunit